MSGLLKKVEQKLGDHPNVSADDSVNPTAGTGIGANDGHDPHKSYAQNKVEAGLGNESEGREPTVKAGSTTAADTNSSAVQGDVTKGGKQL